MTNTEITELAERYVAAWNELDQATRKSFVRQLYASNSRLWTASSDCNGLEEIVSHVDRVVTSFIGADNHRFRVAGVIGHHDWVLLRWEMVSNKAEAVADWGVNVLVVDADQRIEADAQFVAPTWDD
jgi:hypothetical protein